MSKVLVISLSELANDPRVLRQLEFLALEHDCTVTAFGNAPAGLPAEFRELPKREDIAAGRPGETAARVALRAGGRYRAAYWRDPAVRCWRRHLVEAMPADVVIANDLFALPLAQSLGSSYVIFDAHEHWTSESASWTRLQRMSMRGSHEWIVDACVSKTDGVMTVSQGIADGYAVRASVRPVVVTNAPFFQDLKPVPATWPLRLVHLGVADSRRQLENIIDAVRSLDSRFTLDLILARDNDYRRRLEGMAALDEGIRVLRPVPPREMIRSANSYDVGVYLLPEQFPNQVHSLPNKLFEYIQARLAVAVGPSPEMARIVREWRCGVVASSFAVADFADALAKLTPDRVDGMKANADRAAHALTGESNRELVLNLLRELPR